MLESLGDPPFFPNSPPLLPKEDESLFGDDLAALMSNIDVQGASGTVAPPPKAVPAQMWLPDNFFDSCPQCQAKFSWSLRRHHCRACGNVVCNSCSSHRMVLDSNSLSRVCDVCFAARFLK